MLQTIVLSFVPLFIAINAPTAVPIFASMTANVSPMRRRRIADEAVVAALLVGVLFLVGGQTFFGAVGITENDFRVGGGLVLLVSSVLHLSTPYKKFSTSHKNSNNEDENPETSLSGASPLGIPLVMGPASITTIILVAKSHGFVATLIAIALNLVISWFAFRNAQILIRWIGLKNMSVISKLASLVLVSISVMMIRVGIKSFLG